MFLTKQRLNMKDIYGTLYKDKKLISDFVKIGVLRGAPNILGVHKEISARA